MQLLVKLGANPALANKIGHDAVFEAERNEKDEVVKWFLAEVPGLEQAINRDSPHDHGEEEADEMVIENGGASATRHTIDEPTAEVVQHGDDAQMDEVKHG